MLERRGAPPVTGRLKVSLVWGEICKVAAAKVHGNVKDIHLDGKAIGFQGSYS